MGPRVTSPERVMMYAELKRTCGNCNETKPLQSFYFKNLHKEARCKSCVSRIRKEAYQADPGKVIARVTKYRTENPEKIRDTKLKQTYGVGTDWFEAKAAEQNYTCACCHKSESTIWRGKPIALSVDHHHESGEPRGLLCMRCNRALGLLDEDTETMARMIVYVGKFKK